MSDLESTVIKETFLAKKVQTKQGEEEEVIPKKAAKLVELGFRTLPTIAYGMASYFPAMIMGILAETVYKTISYEVTGEFHEVNGDIANVVGGGIIFLTALFGFNHYKKMRICDQTLQIDSFETLDRYWGDKEFYPCCNDLKEQEVYDACDFEWRPINQVQNRILKERGYREDSKRDYGFGHIKAWDLVHQGLIDETRFDDKVWCLKRTSSKWKDKTYAPNNRKPIKVKT